MNSYESALLYIARQEIQKIKESGQEFRLDKEEFDPGSSTLCVYGQVFDEATSEQAMNFKDSNNIPCGFGSDSSDPFSYEYTALEILVDILWGDGYQDKVFKLLDEFVIWGDKEDSKWYEI